MEKVTRTKGKRPSATLSRARGNAKNIRSNRAKLLVSIINVTDEKRLKEVLDDFSISVSMVFTGTGTAQSAVLDYLGIGSTEKSIVISLFPESDEESIVREIGKQMSLHLVGRGISFTIPLSGISQIIANGLANAASAKTVEENKIMKAENRNYELIVAVVHADRVDDAMEAARSAGAAGGTIIRARSMENKKAEQLIGLSLSVEQEILLILAKKEGKLAIMEALNERVGLKTDANGVIFSLPVDHTVGIGAEDDFAQEKIEQDKQEKEEEND